jgi:rod shape-determining protein MreC
MEQSNSKFSIPAKTVLGILIFICAILIGITSINNSILAPVQSVVGSVLAPMQRTINRAGAAINDKLAATVQMWSALEENKNLKDRIARLTEENNKLILETAELKRLRELYELDTEYMDYPKVGARIISKDSGNWFHIFHIDKGSDAGIKVDMNVVADGGLVGIVIAVGSNYATVRSIIDDESNVSAMSARTAANCIVAGDLMLYNEGSLRLINIKKGDDIAQDDRIITSDISAKFLPGLLIGFASDIETNPTNLTESGKIVPVVNFNSLREVLVITELKESILE